MANKTAKTEEGKKLDRALIFAAGFGKRLAPLTDTLPKPLITVGGKPLIQYHIEKLVALGVTNLVINSHWLAEKLVAALGDGSAFGAQIQWSHEPEILDTGAGMKNALPLLLDARGETPFITISADVWTDHSFTSLLNHTLGKFDAHLVLVPNPDQHCNGDFSLGENGVVALNDGKTSYTYSGFGIFSPQFILSYITDEKKFPLREALKAAISCGKVTAEVFHGDWEDVGTVDRLNALERRIQTAN